jgi:hypothetical protein
MKNIHIIPTDKPSRLATFSNKLSLSNFVKWEGKSLDWEEGDGINQNIYITSDEEIKEGDWCLLDHNVGISEGYEVLKCDEADTENGWYSFGDMKTGRCKKIILTTDDQLIADGVQAIDDEFLEWFVKNPSCERVDINRDWGYPKIIIPKEEPKDVVLGYKTSLDAQMLLKIGLEEPKQELKVGDNTNFGIITDIKEYSVCFGKNKVGVDIWYKKLDVKLEPKQETMNNNLEFQNEDPSPDSIEDNHPRTNYGEGFYKQVTLEEAAENHHNTFTRDLCYAETRRESFIEGAKWQAEKMYSEEEVFRLTLDALDLGMIIRQEQLVGYTQKSGKELHLEWFEQHKKK